MTRTDAHNRLRAVHDEVSAARFSIGHASRAVAVDPTLLRQFDYDLRPAMLGRCAAKLEATYLLRLFAEFEAVLRSYYAYLRPSPRPRRIRMESLMNRIAAARMIDEPIVRHAHSVRDYRNQIVHDRATTPLFSFATCKTHLNHYVSYLLREW